MTASPATSPIPPTLDDWLEVGLEISEHAGKLFTVDLQWFIDQGNALLPYFLERGGQLPERATSALRFAEALQDVQRVLNEEAARLKALGYD